MSVRAVVVPPAQPWGQCGRQGVRRTQQGLHPTPQPPPPGHAVTQLRAPHRRVRDTRRVQARACAPPASACAAARPARPCRCAPTRHCGPGGSPTRGGRSGAERRPFTPHSAVCALPLGAEPPPPASPPLSQPFGGRWSGCRGVWAALTFLSLQPVPKLAENSRFCYFFCLFFPSLPLSPSFSFIWELCAPAAHACIEALASTAGVGGAEGQRCTCSCLHSQSLCAHLAVLWAAALRVRGVQCGAARGLGCLGGVGGWVWCGVGGAQQGRGGVRSVGTASPSGLPVAVGCGVRCDAMCALAAPCRLPAGTRMAAAPTREGLQAAPHRRQP